MGNLITPLWNWLITPKAQAINSFSLPTRSRILQFSQHDSLGQNESCQEGWRTRGGVSWRPQGNGLCGTHHPQVFVVEEGDRGTVTLNLGKWHKTVMERDVRSCHMEGEAAWDRWGTGHYFNRTRDHKWPTWNASGQCRLDIKDSRSPALTVPIVCLLLPGNQCKHQRTCRYCFTKF